MTVSLETGLITSAFNRLEISSQDPRFERLLLQLGGTERLDFAALDALLPVCSGEELLAGILCLVATGYSPEEGMAMGRFVKAIITIAPQLFAKLDNLKPFESLVGHVSWLERAQRLFQERKSKQEVITFFTTLIRDELPKRSKEGKFTSRDHSVEYFGYPLHPAAVCSREGLNSLEVAYVISYRLVEFMDGDLDTSKLLHLASYKLALAENDTILAVSSLFSLLGGLLSSKQGKPIEEVVAFLQKGLAKRSQHDLMTLELTKGIATKLGLAEEPLTALQITHLLRDPALPVLKPLHLVNPILTLLLLKPLPIRLLADLLEAFVHYVNNRFTGSIRLENVYLVYCCSFIQKLVNKSWTYSSDDDKTNLARIFTALTTLEGELQVVEGFWKKRLARQAISALVARAHALRLQTRGSQVRNVEESVREKNEILKAIRHWNVTLDAESKKKARAEIDSLARVVLSGSSEEMHLIVVDSKQYCGTLPNIIKLRPKLPESSRFLIE